MLGFAALDTDWGDFCDLLRAEAARAHDPKDRHGLFDTAASHTGCCGYDPKSSARIATPKTSPRRWAEPTSQLSATLPINSPGGFGATCSESTPACTSRPTDSSPSCRFRPAPHNACVLITLVTHTGLNSSTSSDSPRPSSRRRSGSRAGEYVDARAEVRNEQELRGFRAFGVGRYHESGKPDLLAVELADHWRRANRFLIGVEQLDGPSAVVGEILCVIARRGIEPGERVQPSGMRSSHSRSRTSSCAATAGPAAASTMTSATDSATFVASVAPAPAPNSCRRRAITFISSSKDRRRATAGRRGPPARCRPRSPPAPLLQ